MKSKAQYFTFLAVVLTAAPATADIIYGSLQQTISTDYTGVTVTVGAGTLNPFFGGAGVANNNALQPFRLAATGLSTIKDFGTGVTIDSGSGALATGAGGSINHLGTQFTDGTQGYVGFKLDAANYGWMRVVLTNNTSTPVTPMVKDWAYDNTGAAIKTGWINTDIITGTTQTVTLNPATGEAFTLGSQLANASGSITNSVLKTGAGTTTLTGTNTYSGTTALSNGTLFVNGSITGSGAVTVAAGTATGTPLATLGGSGNGTTTGMIGGNVSLTAESSSGFKNGGVLAPTAAASGTKLSVAGTTTFGTGSIFEWDMSATTPGTDPGVVSNSGSYGQLAGTGAISGSNAVFKIVLGAGNTFADAFWNTNKSWDNVFTGTGATNNLSSIFSSISNPDITFAANQGTVAGQGYFAFSGTSTLSWTAVPEPTSALAGLLLGAGLMRRRRW